jgi:hypothetical protein
VSTLFALSTGPIREPYGEDPACVVQPLVDTYQTALAYKHRGLQFLLRVSKSDALDALGIDGTFAQIPLSGDAAEEAATIAQIAAAYNVFLEPGFGNAATFNTDAPRIVGRLRLPDVDHPVYFMFQRIGEGFSATLACVPLAAQDDRQMLERCIASLKAHGESLAVRADALQGSAKDYVLEQKDEAERASAWLTDWAIAIVGSVDGPGKQ